MSKERIISHMNKDHSASLEDYAVFYNKINIDGKIVTMTDITLDTIELEIASKGGNSKETTTIKFDKPMESFTESRSKLVDMAHEAASGLGKSPYTVKSQKFALKDVPFAALCAFILVAGVFPSLWKRLEPISSVLSSIGVRYGRSVAIATLLIHVAESYFFVKPLLYKYRTPTHDKLLWYATALLDGYPTVLRFKKQIAEVSAH